MDFQNDADLRVYNLKSAGRRMNILNVVMGIATLVLVGIAYWKAPQAMTTEIKQLSITLVTILPLVILGLMIASLLAVLAMKGFMQKWIRLESGVKKDLISIVGGTIVPGEPLIGLPIVLGIKEAGAEDKDLIVFMTAWRILTASKWPEIIAFLGPLVLIFYLASSLLVTLFAGCLFRRYSGIINK